MPNLGHLFRNTYPRYKASGLARTFKMRRYRKILELLEVEAPATILDVGCGTGADFTRFAVEDGFLTHGLDIQSQDQLCEFTFTEGNATALPFPDKHFDAVVSIGLFEHIQPIEDLCAAAQEISRVGRRYCVLVPSVGTLVEPHTLAPLWAMRDRNHKDPTDYALNFLSDEAWLQLSGFSGASTKRLWYLPGIQNLLIFGGQ